MLLRRLVENGVSMKLFWFFCFIVALASCSAKGEAGIHFTYSPTLDSICSFFNGPDISADWQEELEGKTAELKREWNAIGKALISTTENIAKHPLDLTGKTAHLTLCNTPSRSFPLIINMRYSLSSYTKQPVSIQDKIGTLYHELLHPYIKTLRPELSLELKKYKNEHELVREHIHLLALLKSVYLKLNLESQLSSLVKMDSRFPNGHYKRAWEIVNSSEYYYEVLIAELVQP